MWSTSKQSALASKGKMSFCPNDKLQFARKDAGGFQLCTMSNKVAEQKVFSKLPLYLCLVVVCTEDPITLFYRSNSFLSRVSKSQMFKQSNEEKILLAFTLMIYT